MFTLKHDGNCGRCGRPMAAGSDGKYARHNVWHPTYADCYVEGSAPVYEDGELVSEGVLNTRDVTPYTPAEGKIQARIDAYRAAKKAGKANGAKVKPAPKVVKLPADKVADVKLPEAVLQVAASMSPEQAAIFVRSWEAAQ